MFFVPVGARGVFSLINKTFSSLLSLSGGTELGVTYLPSTISSDAGYADLPLPLLGAPIDIGALVKLGCGLLRSKTPMGQPWVPDFWGATVGSRTKIVNRGSPRPAFSFACAGQPDQIVNL